MSVYIVETKRSNYNVVFYKIADYLQRPGKEKGVVLMLAKPGNGYGFIGVYNLPGSMAKFFGNWGKLDSDNPNQAEAQEATHMAWIEEDDNAERERIFKAIKEARRPVLSYSGDPDSAANRCP